MFRNVITIQETLELLSLVLGWLAGELQKTFKGSSWLGG